jgi:Na+/proline symporter
VAVRIDFDTAYQHLATHQPSLLMIAMPAALLAVFNNLLFGFGEVFHNNVWLSRAFAMRGDVAPKAFLLAGVLWFPIPIAAGFIALAAGPMGINVPELNQTGPLVASTVMAQSGLGAAAGVLILVVLFCSMASSIDSLLAATSDLLIRDFHGEKPCRPGDENGFRRIAVIAILTVGGVAWLLALPHWPIVNALFISGPLVGSLIWPIIAGLFWRGVNRQLVIAGIVAGSALGLVAYFQIGWFSASLVGTAVSMGFTIAARWIVPADFPAVAKQADPAA